MSGEPVIGRWCESDLRMWLYAIEHGKHFERHCDNAGTLPTNKATLRRKLQEHLARGTQVRVRLLERDDPDENCWEFFGLTGNPGPYEFIAPKPEVLRTMMEREEISGDVRRVRKTRRSGTGGPL